MIMQKDVLNNVNIQDEQVLITPESLKQKYPLSHSNLHAIATSRKVIADIIHQRDPRLLVVCGPCSIHDVDAAIEYGERLQKLAAELSDSLYIVMRVYFEKPRTTVGWKGLISDPFMDGSFEMEKGLHIARDLLTSLVNMGLPLATEALDPNNPQYLGDLFSWSAIGARTTESQTHRENDQSYYYFMHQNLFDHVNIPAGNTHLPDGMEPDSEKECRRYEELIQSMGSVDLQLLGIGHNGHIGFNEPADAFDKLVHCVNLTQSTIEANKRFFASAEEVPRQAYTMGIQTIMRSKKILIIANGEGKADIVRDAFFGPITPMVPASVLQLHNDVTLVADEAALSKIPASFV